MDFVAHCVGIGSLVAGVGDEVVVQHGQVTIRVEHVKEK
jgi:hypothetical protein